MNAMDMLKNAAMEKMLPGVIDKLLENIPPDVLAQITQIGQFVSLLNARLATIETQNRLIMDALKIGTTENENVERREMGTGRSTTAGSTTAGSTEGT